MKAISPIARPTREDSVRPRSTRSRARCSSSDCSRRSRGFRVSSTVARPTSVTQRLHFVRASSRMHPRSSKLRRRARCAFAPASVRVARRSQRPRGPPRFLGDVVRAVQSGSADHRSRREAVQRSRPRRDRREHGRRVARRIVGARSSPRLSDRLRRGRLCVARVRRRSLPTLVVISKEGKVIAQRTGVTPGDELERLVNDAL